MDKVTVSLPRATVSRLRTSALASAQQTLLNTLGTYGGQRDGATDADIAEACRDYLAIYDNLLVPVVSKTQSYYDKP